MVKGTLEKRTEREKLGSSSEKPAARGREGSGRRGAGEEGRVSGAPCGWPTLCSAVHFPINL